ncbi:XRE family transcriptional regulator [Patescibacteria group bacterium]|nr:XRE family transcriptional regulator [Patescibacteria group bacterium]
MDIAKLKQFLINAKKNTYASGGENKVKFISGGMKEYIFNDGNFKYIDRYKGHEKFNGEENVLQNNKIIWKMKYEGKILSNKISADDIYSFLRKALKKIPNDKPMRGLEELINKEYKYINNIKGDIEKFSGEEKIFYKNELVYSLICSGKIIK